MNHRKLLSLCLIARDDNDLKKCLREFEKTADEILIADLSDDGKVADAAKKEGANVWKLKWKDDFSEIKNFFMEKASGRWILFVQPDETISNDDLTKIRPLLDDISAEGYLILTKANSPNSSIISPVQELRLIRNWKEYRFSYSSYEKLPDELFGGIKGTDITIKNRRDGSLSWEYQERQKLFHRELMHHTEDGYLQYLAGLEQLNRQKIDESIPHFLIARKNSNYGSIYAPHLFKCLGWALLSLERFGEAIDVLNEGIEFFPFYTDLYVLRAVGYQQLKRDIEALNELKYSIKQLEQPVSLFPASEIGAETIQNMMDEIRKEDPVGD